MCEQRGCCCAAAVFCRCCRRARCGSMPGTTGGEPWAAGSHVKADQQAACVTNEASLKWLKSALGDSCQIAVRLTGHGTDIASTTAASDDVLLYQALQTAPNSRVSASAPAPAQASAGGLVSGAPQRTHAAAAGGAAAAHAAGGASKWLRPLYLGMRLRSFDTKGSVCCFGLLSRLRG